MFSQVKVVKQQIFHIFFHNYVFVSAYLPEIKFSLASDLYQVK